MKAYEKPRLVALSISSNDMLCESCAIDIHGSNANPDYLQTIALMEEMGISTDFLFDVGSCEYPVSGYCKFTSVNIIINS